MVVVRRLLVTGTLLTLDARQLHPKHNERRHPHYGQRDQQPNRERSIRRYGSYLHRGLTIFVVGGDCRFRTKRAVAGHSSQRLLGDPSGCEDLPPVGIDQQVDDLAGAERPYRRHGMLDGDSAVPPPRSLVS